MALPCLGLNGPPQRAHCPEFTLFRKQRAALRASSFGWVVATVSSSPVEGYSIGPHLLAEKSIVNGGVTGGGSKRLLTLVLLAVDPAFIVFLWI
ncbi:MAG TPA: hypothetical protein VK673_12875 [Chthoniobacterales bacterium]|nr:hypothetical protein [Chthoniobacterales bacterium]